MTIRSQRPVHDEIDAPVAKVNDNQYVRQATRKRPVYTAEFCYGARQAPCAVQMREIYADFPRRAARGDLGAA